MRTSARGSENPAPRRRCETQKQAVVPPFADHGNRWRLRLLPEWQRYCNRYAFPEVSCRSKRWLRLEPKWHSLGRGLEPRPAENEPFEFLFVVCRCRTDRSHSAHEYWSGSANWAGV